MNIIDHMENKKTERMKEILLYPPNKRTNKMLLEIMNFTKVKFK